MEGGRVFLLAELLKEVGVGRIPHCLVFDDLADRSKDRTGTSHAHREFLGKSDQLSTYIEGSQAARSWFICCAATDGHLLGTAGMVAMTARRQASAIPWTIQNISRVDWN
jgi:hypothetical protein